MKKLSICLLIILFNALLLFTQSEEIFSSRGNEERGIVEQEPVTGEELMSRSALVKESNGSRLLTVTNITDSYNGGTWAVGHLINPGKGKIWEGKSDKAAIYLDLGELKRISHVKILFKDPLNYSYGIEVLTAAGVHSQSYRKASSFYWSNRMEGFQEFYLHSSVEARFIKIACYGNDSTDSILDSDLTLIDEIDIFGWDMEKAAENEKRVESELSNIPTPTPPLSPGSFKAVAESSTTVRLTWSDRADNESYYEIRRSDSGISGSFTHEIVAGMNSTQYIERALQPATNYMYRIRAVNSAGSSSWSSPVSVITWDEMGNKLVGDIILDNDTPQSQNRPEGYTIKRGYYGWADINEATAYEGDFSHSFYKQFTTETGDYEYHINVEEAGLYEVSMSWPYHKHGEPYAKFTISVNGGNIEFEVDQSVEANAGRWYTFGTWHFSKGSHKVSATNRTSVAFNERRTICDVLRFRHKAPIPQAPTGLKANPITYKELALNWVDNSTLEKGFKIWRRRYNESDFVAIGEVDANVTGFSDKTADPDIKYHYKVQAINGKYVSAFSNIESVITMAVPPNPPSGLKTSPVDEESIVLTWRDNSNNESGFDIRHKEDGTGDFTLAATARAGIGRGQKSYTVRGLKHGTTYHFKLRAINSGGVSDFTNVASDTTLIPIEFTNPKGEELQWEKGTVQTISWIKQPNVKKVKLELYKDSRAYMTISDEKMPLETTHEWVVDFAISENSNYQIVGTDLSNDILKGYSSLFTIKNYTQSVLFDSSLKNGYLERGDNFSIKWTGLKDGGRLYIFNDYTKSYTDITALNAGEESYNWKIPTDIFIKDQSVDITQKCLFVMKDKKGEKVLGSSEAFMLGKGRIRFLNDNTGDLTWIAGTEQTILFEKTKYIESLDIELYSLNGKLVQKIATTHRGDNSVTFTLKEEIEARQYYMLVIVDSQNRFISDEMFVKVGAAKPAFSKVKTDIILADNFDRWLPNTGQKTGTFEITVKAMEVQNGQEVETSLKTNYNDVRLLPPIDPYWETNDRGLNNINRNKGKCYYELWAITVDDNTDDNDYLLATFHEAQNPGDATNDLFDIKYNSRYMVADTTDDSLGSSRKMSGYRLTVDDTDDKLKFTEIVNPDDPSSDIIVAGKFALRIKDESADTNHPIRPGDDLLLNFGLAHWSTNSSNRPIEHVTNENDFFAVYDKSMLDYANMYIDERITPLTGENKIQRRANETEQEFTERLNALDWNGRNQINLNPFTYFNYDQNSATNTPTYGAVAYSYADHDSPQEYNGYVEQQLELIQWFYSSQNPHWNAQRVNPQPDWANWNSYFAPGGVWENYLYYGNFANVPVEVNGSLCYPYQAGYSLFMLRDNKFAWYKSGQSAGVDCVGLVQRSASESPIVYDLPMLSTWPWTANATEAESYRTLRRSLVVEGDPQRDYDNMWEITNYNNETLVSGIFTNSGKIIPGDVLYYWWGKDDSYYHVTMVLSVDIDANERKVILANLGLIESTFDTLDQENGNFGRVINNRTAEYYHSEESRNWKIGRLKFKRENN